MSYILDALRRADAERKSGKVPDIHTQPMPQRARPRSKSALTAMGLWVLVGLVTLATLAAAWLWRLPSSDLAPDVRVSAASPQAATTAPAPSPSPATLPSSQTVPSRVDAPAANAPVAAVAPARPSPPPTQPPADAVRRSLPTPLATPVPMPVPLPTERRESAVTRTPSPAVTRPAAADEPRAMTRAELPPDVQRQLPTLAMSGSVYSPQAQNRMVIVDGRLVFEGEQVAVGLVVERIQPKSVVMRFQNHRFTVPL